MLISGGDLGLRDRRLHFIHGPALLPVLITQAGRHSTRCRHLQQGPRWERSVAPALEEIGQKRETPELLHQAESAPASSGRHRRNIGRRRLPTDSVATAAV